MSAVDGFRLAVVQPAINREAGEEERVADATGLIADAGSQGAPRPAAAFTASPATGS